MNLVIDIGNTRTKWHLFNGEELIRVIPLSGFRAADVEELLTEYPELNKAIVSSVGNFPEETRAILKARFPVFIELNAATPLPIKNCYQSLDTLGYDRIAAVVGAHSLYPGKNILVVDAGSALTYDVITDRGTYLGGNISPGLAMRFRALHDFTGRLPLVGENASSELFGNTTETAIRAGVQNGIVYEVDNTIALFKKNYRNLMVIITGGDANFFAKKLKSFFFVHFNLTGIGLNRILEYNGETHKG
jgi:type III pantothenate kinase